MLKGAPLFLLICLLASAPLYSRTLGQLAVGALAVLYLMTLTSVKSKPGRRPVQPLRETDLSES